VAARLPPRDRGTLIVVAGSVPGAVHPVEGRGEFVLGRGAAAAVSLEDQSLSRRHARIFRTAEGYFVEDLGSTNGTFVIGERLAGARLLRDGDRIQLGLATVLRFALYDAAEQETAQQLFESAVRDPLTGLYNRRYLDDRLTAELSFALRHETALTVMLADVDHFKRVNDTYGHAAGDAVLRAVGASLQRTLRSEDIVARYGGEEFCIVSRALDARNAEIVAERCRSVIAALAIPWEDSRLGITVSIGVATLSETSIYADTASLVDAADRALYLAKESGRNCVRRA
jgi:diguanylate cyclase (GGDEF)-like protein